MFGKAPLFKQIHSFQENPVACLGEVITTELNTAFPALQGLIKLKSI